MSFIGAVATSVRQVLAQYAKDVHRRRREFYRPERAALGGLRRDDNGL